MAALLAVLLTIGVLFVAFLNKDGLMALRWLEVTLMAATVCFQVYVIFRTKRVYAPSEWNLYFIHPAFYINAAIIFYFFCSLLFYMFNPGIFYKWVDLDNILVPLAYFCLSVVVMNCVILLFDRKTRALSERTVSFDKIIDVFRQRLPMLFGFLALAWLLRLMIVFAGTYSMILADPELKFGVRMQYPLLYPAFIFFNQEIYFSVLFILWILYFTALRTNKAYRNVLVVLLFADIVYFLPMGGKQTLLQPLLAYGLAGLMLKKNVAKKLAVVVLLFIFTLPIYNSYRVLGGTLEGSVEVASVKESYVFGESRGYASLAVDSVFRRGEAFASYFFYTQTLGNNFLEGATYRSIVSRALPDFLLPLPDSLKDTQTAERLKDMGLIHPRVYLVAGATATWGEFYLNFGYWGLVIGMGLLGVFCLFFFKGMLHVRRFDVFVIYSYLPLLFFFLAHAEMATLVSPLIKITVVIVVANLLAKLLLRKRSGVGGRTHGDGALRGAY
jgi:hypothetical protein